MKLVMLLWGQVGIPMVFYSTQSNPRWFGNGYIPRDRAVRQGSFVGSKVGDMGVTGWKGYSRG